MPMAKAHRATMQSESYFSVRLDGCSGGGLIALIWSFLMLVAVSAMMGQVAPVVYKSSGKSSELACRTYDCTPSFYGYLNRITKRNQLVFLELTMNKPMEHHMTLEQVTKDKIDMPLELRVTVEGEHADDKENKVMLIQKQKIHRNLHCPADSDKCSPVVLWGEPFLDFEGYHVQVQFIHPYEQHGLVKDEQKRVKELLEQGGVDMQHMHDKAKQDERFIPHAVEGIFEMKYVNTRFTNFQFATKYTVLVVTLVIGFWYQTQLRKVDYKFRSYEQHWVSILLMLLVLFNDPFFAVEVYTASSFWTGLYVMAEATFIVMLLLFFLCVFDIVGSPSYQEGEGRVLPWSFYLPKLLICAPLWMFNVLIYMYVRLQDQSDPSYTEPMDMTHFAFAKEALDLFLLIYMIYAGFLLFTIMYNVMAKGNTPEKKYKYLFAVTLLSFLFTIIGEEIGAFSPEIVEKEAFFFFLGSANSYIWLLAFCYCPNAVEGRDSGSRSRSRRNPSRESPSTSGRALEMSNPLADPGSGLRMENQNLPNFDALAADQKEPVEAVAQAEAVGVDSDERPSDEEEL